MTHKQAEERILHDAENFCVRKAKPDEAAELYQMFKRHLYPDLIWVERILGPGALRSGRELSLVAIEKKTGKVIGGIERDVDKLNCSAHGFGLVVLSDFRNKGIGTALAKAIDKELEAMGIKRVTVDVASDDAWEIYRKEGYEYNAKTKAYLRENGLPEDRFVEKLPMTKELGREPAREVFHVEVSREGFEKAAQDVGGVKKQMVMLVTWGCHTPERQFTGDVAELIQKTKGERGIKIHELKSFTHAMDIAEKHWEKTGKDYSDRKQDALWKTERFQNLRAYNDMLRVAGKEGASAIVDLHYSPFATHAPWPLSTNSKPTELKSNPIVYLDVISKEVFEEYSKIPGINIDFKEVSSGVKPLKRLDRLGAFLRRFDYREEKALEDALREHRYVSLEGFVFHLPHKEGEKCEISREEYTEVVASAADTVIRIYDHFNSKLQDKEKRR